MAAPITNEMTRNVNIVPYCDVPILRHAMDPDTRAMKSGTLPPRLHLVLRNRPSCCLPKEEKKWYRSYLNSDYEPTCFAVKMHDDRKFQAVCSPVCGAIRLMMFSICCPFLAVDQPLMRRYYGSCFGPLGYELILLCCPLDSLQ